MLLKWPIRRKLAAGLALLIVIVVMLSWGGINGLYSYRRLVRSLMSRAPELPRATQVVQAAGRVRLALEYGKTVREFNFFSLKARFERGDFRLRLSELEHALRLYKDQIESYADASDSIGDRSREWEKVRQIESKLQSIRRVDAVDDWLFDDAQVDKVEKSLAELEQLAAALPTYLHDDILSFTEDARVQYRTLIVLTCVTSAATLAMFLSFVRMFYLWIFRPLRVLIKGSRKVAAGQFDYRIQLETHDEMSELAAAMNDMTARFRAIRDDLDRQVKERTRQVVRGEQLASVGFLAAGVAHEINNPLASIAMCAESLESRMGESLAVDEDPQDQVIRDYLRMIQTEAFRCKEITEKLLDFSRLGESRRQATPLRDVVQGVIDMLRHLPKYAGRSIDFAPGPSPTILSNPQEMKQVVLNLLTNALDSVDAGGRVAVDLRQHAAQAELAVRDDGCGMAPDVIEHIFEPFFTRRRQGQGTGLGLSITYRIVADHGGTIEAHSDGPRRGSTFRVRLPLAPSLKETHHRDHQQAA